MKTCAWVTDHLDDFVDAELGADDTREIETHLETCDECRAELTAMNALLANAAALPRRIEPLRDLWPEIESQLRGRVVRFPDWRRHGMTTAYAAVVAAAVVLAVSIGLSRAPVLNDYPESLTVAKIVEDTAGIFDYDRAVLRAAYLARSEEIDPQLRSVIDTNLTIIQSSVTEIQSAIQQSPDNPRLKKMLRTACLSEVEMLQQVVYEGLEG